MHIFLNAISFVTENIKNTNLIYIFISAAMILTAAVKIQKSKKQKKLDVLFIISDDGEYYDSNMNKIPPPHGFERPQNQQPQQDPNHNDAQEGEEENNEPSGGTQLITQEEKQKIEDTISLAGYAYDVIQDIFYSRLDAWQRKFGYCQLYDEACAPMSMIIDCEPIYFDYANKHWLIEFWKGQYGMTAGCEVGVYSSKWPNLNIPGIFNGIFYKCADDDNLLDISYTLYRNGKTLFKRQDKHWWLTGFILGDFIPPHELMMDIKIIFKNSLMQSAFVGGLKNAGYKPGEIRAINNVVYITFKTPHTKQPNTRTEEMEEVTQERNELICRRFQSITKGLDNIYDKIYAVKQHDPDIYEMIFDFGKSKDVYGKFNLIKKAIEFFTGDDNDEDGKTQTPADEDAQTIPPEYHYDFPEDTEQENSQDNQADFEYDYEDEPHGEDEQQYDENDDETTEEEEQPIFEDNDEEDLNQNEEDFAGEDVDSVSQEEKQEIEEKLRIAGFAYDASQDIFYSIISAWQRQFGYCRLYDEACAPLSMIIDCEPIYFDYGGKQWLIEFWKGQYGMTIGCEVGIFTAVSGELNIPGVFNGTFYKATDDDDFLEISYTAYKNNKPIFERHDKHWWLTGFILGGFAHPDELKMDIKIVFKNSLMQSEFINGLRHAGYRQSEIRAINNIVYISFAKPHTVQPLTRTDEIDALMQAKNKFLCQQYQNLTKGLNNIYEKINALKEKEPEIYNVIFDTGKTKQIFKEYEIIKKYL